MNVTIVTRQEVNLQEYYVLRGICEGIGGVKNVIAERKFLSMPDARDIAKFIMETDCDFASVVANYRIIKDDDLPFA